MATATPPKGRHAIRVAIVDSYLVFCEALGFALSREADLHCVGEATTLEDAVKLLSGNGIDVVVVDPMLSKPNEAAMHAAEVVKVLKDASPDIRIVVLTGDMDL